MIKEIRWSRLDSTFRLICNGCGETKEITGEFEDVLDFMRENEWRSVKEGGAWDNYCPDCKENL